MLDLFVSLMYGLVSVAAVLLFVVLLPILLLAISLSLGLDVMRDKHMKSKAKKDAKGI